MASLDSPPNDDDNQDQAPTHRIPLHEQRTVLITNLSERTTHKDLASIIRGGRLLDIFLRNDRSATVSFVEGAVEFLAYAKRNDIYLHMKRVTHASLAVGSKANNASSNFVGATDSSMCHRMYPTKLPTERRETSSYEALQGKLPQSRFEIT
jgi:hypothetical protein